MFKELPALNFFSTTYDRYSLETVLNQLKEHYPKTAIECDELLELLKKSEYNENVIQYSFEEVTEENETSELKSESKESPVDKVTLSTKTSQTEAPKKVSPPVQVKPTLNSKSNDDISKSKLTASQSRSLVSSLTKPESKINTNGMNPNIPPNNGPKLAKPNNKRTVVEETSEKKQKIEYVVSEEDITEEYSSSEESYEEQVSEKIPIQTQKNNYKASQNRQPIKK